MVRQRHGAVVVRVLAVLFVAWGIVGCANSTEFAPPRKVDAAEIDGPGTLGISMASEPIKGLIVYFHGMDQDATVTQSDTKRRAFVYPLLRAGYAIVSADAGGNAFGNPASLEDYRRLIAAVEAKYAVKPTFFIAESMGGLPALTLLSEDTGRLIKAMVGISPIMGIPIGARNINFVADAWNGYVPDSADPLSFPPEAFAGRTFLLYTSREGDVIPPGATANGFVARFSSVATIEMHDCEGGHVAGGCFDGTQVKDWMTSLS
jgi:pimeloyl-ACP methyl ester carboxylesterase